MKISVIGAGAMGGATVEGLIKGQQFKNEDITVSDPSQAVVEKFSKMGVSVTTDNKLAADSIQRNRYLLLLLLVYHQTASKDGWVRNAPHSSLSSQI